MIATENRTSSTQVVLFLALGSVGLAIEIAFIHWGQMLGFHYLTSDIFGSSLAIIFNYLTSRKLVFNSNQPISLIEFSRYLGSVWVVAGFSIILLLMIEEYFHFGAVLSKLTTIPILAILSFWTKKKFVFN